MARRKLEYVPQGKPKVLRTRDEKDEELRELASAFESWFMKIPGAEWGINPARGLPHVYCRYYAVPDRPDWGKVFVALDISEPKSAQETVLSFKKFPPEMKHWAHLGLTADASREQLRARFSEQFAHAADYDREWIELAYHRCLADLITKEAV